MTSFGVKWVEKFYLINYRTAILVEAEYNSYSIFRCVFYLNVALAFTKKMSHNINKVMKVSFHAVSTELYA